MKNLDDVKYFLYLEDSYKKILIALSNKGLLIENGSNFGDNPKIFVKIMDNYKNIRN